MHLSVEYMSIIVLAELGQCVGSLLSHQEPDVGHLIKSLPRQT